MPPLIADARHKRPFEWDVAGGRSVVLVVVDGTLGLGRLGMVVDHWRTLQTLMTDLSAAAAVVHWIGHYHRRH